jgi:TorA maturation chaperone TorD
MIGENGNDQRADVYELFSQFFLNPPDEETLAILRQDFLLESREPLPVISEEFDELLRFPSGRLQPIESLYTGQMVSEHTDIRSVYAAAGLGLDDTYDVAPDHLSLEFLFMSYLIENGKREMEQKFLEQHLINWVPYYCEEVMKKSQTIFYREIAEIVKDFLISESDAYTR